jgi:hypothetical protein
MQERMNVQENETNEEHQHFIQISPHCKDTPQPNLQANIKMFNRLQQ